MMEIKKNSRIVVTGSSICFIAGIISALCGLYWLIQAIFYDNTNLPMILSSIVVGLYLTMFAAKRRRRHIS